MICSNCGIENDDNLRACMACGEMLIGQSTPSGNNIDSDGRRWAGRETANEGVVVVVYAGFWKRALATTIDSAILAIPCMFIGTLIFGSVGYTKETDIAYTVINIILFWLYSAIMESGRQAGDHW